MPGYAWCFGNDGHIDLEYIAGDDCSGAPFTGDRSEKHEGPFYLNQIKSIVAHASISTVNLMMRQRQIGLRIKHLFATSR
jgi:hypothetical protein